MVLRLAGKIEAKPAATAKATIRGKMRYLIGEFNGLFAKVITKLIAEGQSDPSILRELYDRPISLRRASTIADIERGKAHGEFSADTNPELLVDSLFGPLYYCLLLRFAPLTEQYVDELLNQVLRGTRVRLSRNAKNRPSG